MEPCKSGGTVYAYESMFNRVVPYKVEVAQLYEDGYICYEAIKIDEKPIDYFTDEEIETLRGGCTNLRDRAIVEGLRNTGLRAGEFEQINITDVDWNTGDVWIKREKGGTNTPAYFDKVAIRHIKAYLNMRTDDNPALFVGHRKPYKRIEKADIRSMLKDIDKRQGMTCRVYPHKFRKTLGMNLINKGEDLGTVQAVLGHQNPYTTARSYAKKTPETLRKVRRRTA
ncbi:MAG: tyrosine-type recombinase/integrase [Lachnospiraceae bacterium]